MSPSLAIPLHTIPYNDRYSILHLYSSAHGRIAALIPRHPSRHAQIKLATAGLAVLELELTSPSPRSLFRISECRPAFPLPPLSAHPLKNIIALFLAELLFRILPPQLPDPPLFRFLASSIHSLQLLPPSPAVIPSPPPAVIPPSTAAVIPPSPTAVLPPSPAVIPPSTAVIPAKAGTCHSLSSPLNTFPLLFLAHLLHPLGIFPHTDSFLPGHYFDLLNATFLPLPPPHPHFLPPSDSHTLALLLLSSPHLPPSDIPSPHAQTPPATADSPHAQIEPAIAALLAYYRLHLPPFPPLRSLPLLLSLL